MDLHAPPLDDPGQRNIPVLSVIIPFFGDNVAELLRCVRAIETQSMPSAEREIIVVDNNIHPVVEQALQNSDAIFTHVEKPGSYAARNAGARLAKAKILAFTDSDCIPDKDWLAKGFVAIRNAKHLEAIGGAIQIRPELPNRPKLVEELDQLIHLRQAHFVASIGFAATANLFVKTDDFFRIGAFNEDFLSYGDHDFGLRFRSKGGRISYAGNALVIHPARRSLSDLVLKSMRVVGGQNVRLSKQAKTTRTGLLRWQFDQLRERQALVWAGTQKAGLPRRLSLLLMLYLIYAVRLYEAIRLLTGRVPKRK